MEIFGLDPVTGIILIIIIIVGITLAIILQIRQYKKEKYLKQKFKTYKGEKVLYQSFIQLPANFFYSIILTNKKLYCHRPHRPINLAFWGIISWSIENKDIKSIFYKKTNREWTNKTYYKIKINNKKSFIRSEELEIFLERLKKVNKSIVIKEE